jgi:hypothetical protein
VSGKIIRETVGEVAVRVVTCVLRTHPQIGASTTNANSSGVAVKPAAAYTSEILMPGFGGRQHFEDADSISQH